MLSQKKHLKILSLLALTSPALPACGDEDPLEGNSSLTVLMESEDVILNGLSAGNETVNIRDGWNVSFSKFLTTLGNFTLAYSTMQDVTIDNPTVHILDLANVSANGAPLWNFNGLGEGRWEVFFSTPIATVGAQVHPSVSAADAMTMTSQGWTYLIEGRLDNPNGQSCPPAALAMPGNKSPNGAMSGPNPCYAAPSVGFSLGVNATTRFGPCEIGGSSGVALVDAATQSVSVTMHGDHLFFNGFPEGHEGGVIRLAQWLADCDLNLDGMVTREELQQVSITDLPVIDSRYNLAGPPIAINNMLDYATAQLKTQGHYQGEGACAVDGKAHVHDDHDHDHGDHDHHDH